MPRAVLAAVLPAVAVGVAWARIESPAQALDVVVVVALALAPALAGRALSRAVAASAAGVGALWLAFGAEPWELLPYRDERVVTPVAEAIARGVDDFYGVFLPFEPGQNPEMHALVVMAVFGFVLTVALLVATGRPVPAVAVTIAGAGWPATLVSDGAVVVGALALAGALSIPLLLRSRSAVSLTLGAATAAVVVAGAAWASSATEVAREAALDWEGWNVRGAPAQATSVRFIWESNYDGIQFPPTKTVVLTVKGPERARYWRASTLDLFTDGHWFEDLLWLARVDPEQETIPLDPLTPEKAANRETWVEQEIDVKALVDDHLIAAGTPVAVDSRRLGTVFLLSGGVLRVRDATNAGQRYRIWSYAPDPAPAALDASKPRYPLETDPYLALDGRTFPAYGAPDRAETVDALFSDPAYAHFAPYRPMYDVARRITREAKTPYAAVLALESWLRGEFEYDEQPPRASGPPLVSFVTRTRAGYCQQFAGAMTVMLRMLGIPSRVAVGFTSGQRNDDKWVVTDHEAHAWVEVWFAGHGWVPFDPTPGRGTFGGSYSFASDSEAAVAALRRGQLSGGEVLDRELPDSADIPRGSIRVPGRGPSFVAVALLLGALWIVGVGGGKTVARRLRYATSDPRESAAATRRELEAFLRDQGIGVSSSATLEDLRHAVGLELGLDSAPYTQAAARARFGPPGRAREDAQAARKELRTLLRSIRYELSVWARFRGFVSLRSLRGWSQ